MLLNFRLVKTRKGRIQLDAAFAQIDWQAY